MMRTPNSSYSTDFRDFMAKTCILLFFSVLASKLRSLLITAYVANTNQIQREFHSNVAIATQEFSPASKQSHKKTNLFKQTESKGNFCLITVYSHKTLFQLQATGVKKQTFSNLRFLCALCISVVERLLLFANR
jgi:hypothetical protein